MDEWSREIYGNIDSISKAIFYVLAVASLATFSWGVFRKWKLWKHNRSKGSISWKRVGRRLYEKAFLQKKVRSGPRKYGAGLAHAGLFFGFLLLFIGTCLVAIEEYGQVFTGREADNPLFHKGLYYALYESTLELAGLALIAGCLYFLWRHFKGGSSMESRLSDWAVVGCLLYLGLSGYVIEGARILIEDTKAPGWSFVGYGVALGIEGMGISDEQLRIFHKANWWLHAVVALGFVAAVPYCRLMHIVAGMGNIALRDFELGAMDPVSIDSVEEKGYVGTGSVQDLPGEQLLALDACVSCGRCQDACPAFAAGKPLSPRDLVQDIRVEVDRQQRALAQNGGGDELKPLAGDAISEETLWSCTTCNACVTACPVEVAPLEFITDLRRYLVGEGALSGPAAMSLQKMQRSGNPWGMPASQRTDWAEGLDVPTVAENPDFDVLYWVGCAASYDPRARKIARATAQLLTKAEVNFAYLGPEERCTGDSARRMGEEFLFQELAESNVATLNRYGTRRIVTHCPHCLNALSKDYAQFDGQYEVMHHAQLLQELVDEGRLSVGPNSSERLTYHDPCYLARVNGISEEPRQLLRTGLADPESQLVEMPRNRCQTGCCGGGGGRMWFDDGPQERSGQDRVVEAIDTKTDTVAVSCPFCMTMMRDGLAARDSEVDVKDVSEILLENINR